MTSEVALMNRFAVALAADSATTITYYEDGEKKNRFFKGANKIFNLSTAQPVGLMINGAAGLQKLPWEVIVKKYRESRAGKPLDRLQDYATDFFKYLSSKELFPTDYQEKVLIKSISEATANLVFSIFRDPDVVSATDGADRKARAAVALDKNRNILLAEPYISDAAKKIADEAEKKLIPKIDAEFKSGSLYDLIKDSIDITDIYPLAIRAFASPKYTTMGKTGVVIAGYGNNDIFPILEQYECYGVLLGSVIYRRLDDDCRSISFDIPSEIVPIAQDVMAYTFMFGASLAVIVHMYDLFEREIGELANGLVATGHVKTVADIATLTQKASKNAWTGANEYIHREADKLRRVIGMMPVGELAELAETLVSLESLKERTTRETESVSGPVDVAVITKGDGFIWVKRKHYFDPALNLRFVAKKQKES